MREKFRPYIFNGFLLILPAIAWNAALAHRLPPFFEPASLDHHIPFMITFSEQLFRVLFFIVVFLMPLSRTGTQIRRGGILYILGLLLYFASWVPLVWFPDSSWSVSLLGLSAPSWTPVCWMSGIICLCNGFSFGIPYRKWIPWSLLILFLLFHNLHIFLAFYRVPL
ncbi:MAG: hypothetical protein BGO09_03485 [Bacteroidetes bacterium 47-18]|nr:MAG: hypothetical protein BGO09_03485 [Bacteroidetes bacterium 47-18]